MNKIFSKCLIALVGVTLSLSANAMIDLELTQGVLASVPLAVTQFQGGEVKAPGNQTLNEIVNNDLQNSGEFRVVNQGETATNNDAAQVTRLRQLGADYVLSGSVRGLVGDRYQVHFVLQSLLDGKADPNSSVLLDGNFTAPTRALRSLAHRISDEVYQKLTGVRGVFSTKIAYVLVEPLGGDKTRYQLIVADADGFRPQTLLTSYQPIMSPSWSPDARKLAYVSFEGHHANVFLQDVASGQRDLVSHAPGINGAPAFSPDGTKLALVLSVTGNPQIYLLNLRTHQLRQITNDWSIDTEPSFSADGSSLLFTSNRDGTPQIYQYSFSTGAIQRVTFDGNYNARASFTSNGQTIVLMHRGDDEFGIARFDLESGKMQSLVQGGMDESPSVSPNGKMIIYATQYSGRGVLAQVSTDGRIKLRLPSQEGAVQEPAWSPFIN